MCAPQSIQNAAITSKFLIVIMTIRKTSDEQLFIVRAVTRCETSALEDCSFATREIVAGSIGRSILAEN
jgi:hypothetical protein